MTVDVPGEHFPTLNYDNKNIIRRDQKSSRKQDCPWLEGTVLGLYNKNLQMQHRNSLLLTLSDLEKKQFCEKSNSVWL